MSEQRRTDNRPGTELQSRLEFPTDYDLEEFFDLGDHSEPLVGPSDLEATVPSIDHSNAGMSGGVQKGNLNFFDQYWTQKPYSFVSIWRNERRAEYHYYVIEPSLTETERKVLGFLRSKLRFAIDLEEQPIDVSTSEQKEIIGEAAVNLLDRFNILARTESSSFSSTLRSFVNEKLASLIDRRADASESPIGTELNTDVASTVLTDQQVKKIIYYLWRDYVWYGKLTPIKSDARVEDISCDGYESHVFVDHSDLGEQVITNVTFGQDDLDDFVVNMAQRAGKGISKREPSVDATLPDGSRAQLTLGDEISDYGSHFTIRQFNEVPFTPIDLINWGTFSLDQAVYMWLAIENDKSAIFSGGTASGKTTSLNAMSMFMPANEKVVTIEDTREIEIPHRNHVAGVTRDSYSEDSESAYEEYDLLEDALRQRPSYIIVGEIRGEEGKTLLQTANTGHTTYTTFHAGEIAEVLRRFTTDPINASPTLFEGLDLLLNQESTKANGERVRRVTSIAEMGETSSSGHSINHTFSWDPETDTYESSHAFNSPMLNSIKRENSWSDDELQDEWQRRRLVLAYLSRHNIDDYASVAAVLQAYMAKPGTILSSMATQSLEERVEQLGSMANIEIDISEELEMQVTRPGFEKLDSENQERFKEILADGRDLLQEWEGASTDFGRPAEDEQMQNGSGSVQEADSPNSQPAIPRPEDERDDTVPAGSEAEDEGDAPVPDRERTTDDPSGESLDDLLGSGG